MLGGIAELLISLLVEQGAGEKGLVWSELHKLQK
jgi:hypothetical protein